MDDEPDMPPDMPIMEPPLPVNMEHILTSDLFLDADVVVVVDVEVEGGKVFFSFFLFSSFSQILKVLNCTLEGRNFRQD